jgi:hypothetical protein
MDDEPISARVEPMVAELFARLTWGVSRLLWKVSMGFMGASTFVDDVGTGVIDMENKRIDRREAASVPWPDIENVS